MIIKVDKHFIAALHQQGIEVDYQTIVAAYKAAQTEREKQRQHSNQNTQQMSIFDCMDAES